MTLPFAMLPPSGPALLSPAWAAAGAAALSAPPKIGEVTHISDLADGAGLYAVVGGVALIPVMGMIVPQFPWIGWGGATGCNILRLQLAAAHADPAVNGIAFLVNSGGGLVNGIPDLCAYAMAAKAESGKPVAAVLAEYAYSAAYWFSTTADTIAVPQTGGLGSIGVIMAHWDYAKLLADAGVKVTMITAGARKADGNPYQPLPDDVAARWQGDCEELRRIFAMGVTVNRADANRDNGRTLNLEAVLASEAGVWDTPSRLNQAVALGYADAVMPPDRALAFFIAHVNGQRIL